MINVVLCGYCGKQIADEPGAFVARDCERAEERWRMKLSKKETEDLCAYQQRLLDDRIAQCERLEAANEDLTKRVAELEAWKAAFLEWQETAAKLIKSMQAQLAWTPVAQGLPTEPGMYVFVNVEADYFTLFELDPIGCWVRHEHQERVQLTAITDNWRAFRRITLPEAT